MPGTERSGIRGWLLALAAVAYAIPVSGALDGWLNLGVGQGAALGIVLAALILWVSEAVPLFVTGAVIAVLGAAVLAPTLGLPSDTFVTPFASDVSLLFLGGFVLSDVLRLHGLDRAFAGPILARTGTRPDRVLAGVMIATASLSMWISNTASCTVMLALITPVLAAIPAGDPLRRALVMGVAASANFGGWSTPVSSPPNAVAMATMARVAEPPGFALWMLLAIPVLVVVLALSWRALLALHPPTVTAVEVPIPPMEWTDAARGAAALTALTVGLWLTTGLHPLTPGTVGLLPVVVAFGSGLLPATQIRQLPWDILGVVGGGMCLGAVVAESGLDRQLLGALDLGGLGTVGVLVVVGLVATSLSTVMSNTAASNLLLPVVVAIPDVPVLPLALVTVFACSSGVALPVSTPSNTLAFGTGELDARTFTRTGLILTAIALGSTLALGLPWWRLVVWALGLGGV